MAAACILVGLLFGRALGITPSPTTPSPTTPSPTTPSPTTPSPTTPGPTAPTTLSPTTPFPTFGPSFRPPSPDSGLGQCCGDNFCYVGIAETCTGVWNSSHACADESCVPKKTTVGQGGVSYGFETRLSTLNGLLSPGEQLGVEPATLAQLPQTPGGAASVGFSVSYLDANGDQVHELLPAGSWLEVDVTSTPAYTAANPIAVYRWGEELSPPDWVDILSDCTTAGGASAVNAANQFISATSAWRVRICHTSFFAVAAASDAADEKDSKPSKKPQKDTKLKPPSKKASKKGKTGLKKEKAGKVDGKAKKVAIGAAVGGVSALAVVGGLILWRRNNNKRQHKPTSSKPAVAAVPVRQPVATLAI